MDNEQYRAGLERLAGRSVNLSTKKEQTRRRIVESATELISKRGLRRTSMDEIAERAGISRGTLYTYAKNKEDVVIKALAEEQLSQMEHRATPFDGELSPADRLRALVADSIATFERTPLLALLVKGDVELLRSLEQHPDVTDAFPDDDHQLLTRAIRSAFKSIPATEADGIATVLRALREAGPYLVESAPSYGLTPQKLADKLANLLVTGIEPR